MHICVYCASSDEIEQRYRDVAVRLGERIGRRGDTLVYGGGRVGLMGRIAQAVHAHGGGVVGVIPESLSHVEIAYREADELIVTDTMRERKQIMDDRSDAFVVLPGGFGTLEELAEMLVLKILGYHDRPIVIVNCFGFYDGLLTLFDEFIEHRFAKPKHRDLYDVADDAGGVYAVLDGG